MDINVSQGVRVNGREAGGRDQPWMNLVSIYDYDVGAEVFPGFQVCALVRHIGNNSLRLVVFPSKEWMRDAQYHPDYEVIDLDLHAILRGESSVGARVSCFICGDLLADGACRCYPEWEREEMRRDREDDDGKAE